MRYGSFRRATLRPVKLKRPSGLTLLAGALLLLMPALAALQFRWVGQVSAAEQARMERNLDIAARQFQQAFNQEIITASIQLSVGPETARDEAWHRFATRRDDWVSNTSRPDLVKNIYFVDAGATGTLQVRRWDTDAVRFQPVDWPDVLEPWRQDFEEELVDFRIEPGRRREQHFQRQDALLIRPQPFLVEPALGRAGRPVEGPAPAMQTSIVFGFTIIELNMPYIQQ